MQKLWKLVFIFWRGLFLWNVFFSVAAFIGLTTYGAGFSGLGLFFKLIGYGSTVYFRHHFSSQNNYYFLNAGFSIQKMYTYTFCADFGLYLMAEILYFTTHHH